MRRLAVGLAAGVALVLAAPGRSETPPISARASFAPQAHLFGDPVTATLELGVDPARVDPETVRVEAAFAPYATTARGVERLPAGPHLVVLRFTWRLRCLAAGCAPLQPQKVFSPAPATVSYRTRGGRAASGPVDWPPLAVGSRLTPKDMAMPAMRATTAPPAGSARVPLEPLGIALVVAGGLLATAALGTLAVLYRPRRRVLPVPPLQQALDGLERAAAAPVGERRRALYALALALERAGIETFARESRKLAWTAAAPAPERIRALADRIRGRLREAA